MKVPVADISNALLVSTRDGSYPDSEAVLTTDLDVSTLPSSLRLIETAKHQIEIDIRGHSQNNSSNVDEWITQARRLQEDIEHSKTIAREIVKEHEEGQDLLAKVQDTEAKLALLQTETSFNQAVTSFLKEIWLVDKELNEAEAALASGGLVELAANFQQLASHAQDLADSNAKDINLARASEIRNTIVDGFTRALNSMVVFEKTDGRQQMRVQQGNNESLPVSLEYLVDGLEKFDSLDAPLRTIVRIFQRKIIQPVMSRSPDAITCSSDETTHCLTLYASSNKKDVQGVINCLISIFAFLREQLPLKLSFIVGTMMSEEVIGHLIRDWLTPSIPLGLREVQQSYDIQTMVSQLADLISTYEWHGHLELKLWIKRIPQTWLEIRRISSLDAVRATFKMQRGPNREAQKVERQDIFSNEETFVNSSVDPSEDLRTEQRSDLPKPSIDFPNNQEEDLSGWDFDEETDNNSDTKAPAIDSSEDVKDGSEAWGWDEDSPDNMPSKESKSSATKVKTGPANGSMEHHREVILTETYTITDIPDHLLDIISHEVEDASQIHTTEDAAFKRISASADLLSLPTLSLAMFRAVAPAYYTTAIANGNMHLYNDCVYMVEKLGSLGEGTSMSQLREECDALEKFGRSAYTREMEVQRTVLGDLLDGAQGFVNCTRFPYSGECENAVGATIDRLRTVHQDWSSILSRSALLQSIGSLLSSVIEKMVKDIEDMEDISEAESLRLTAFCSRFSALEDLFISERPRLVEEEEAEMVPLTAVYVSNWLRFQYLSNILESSLVDIKYLWTEGELRLEFTADEVIELIQALFAESSHRRSAIAEIRRGRS